MPFLQWIPGTRKAEAAPGLASARPLPRLYSPKTSFSIAS